MATHALNFFSAVAVGRRLRKRRPPRGKFAPHAFNAACSFLARAPLRLPPPKNGKPPPLPPLLDVAPLALGGRPFAPRLGNMIPCCLRHARSLVRWAKDPRPDPPGLERQRAVPDAAHGLRVVALGRHHIPQAIPQPAVVLCHARTMCTSWW